MYSNRKGLQHEDITNYELLKTSWKYQTTEFFKNSSLHGIKYIGDEKRPFHEKFVWFSFLLTGSVATLVIIASLWEKFQTSPTITGLDTDFHNWDVPFPAITLCATDSTDHEKVEAFIKKQWGNITEEDFEYYKGFVTSIANLSYDNFNRIVNYTNRKLESDINIRHILTQVVTRCEDMLSDCMWKGQPYACCDGFYPIMTERGFCYTFNSKHFEPDLWKESDKPMSEPEIKYIYETDNDLFLSFANKDIATNPISIYIHSNNETIGQDLPPHHKWHRRIGKIYFEPKETYTTEDARQLSIKQRHCVFPDEIRLITDDTYTYTACMTQCRMEMAATTCGCIPFFYDEIGNFKHCDLIGMECLVKYKGEISKGHSCKCELGCMNTVYEAIKLEDSKPGAKDIFEVSFVSWPMIRYKRDVLFGWVDLFVAFGGIAGLFLGFSLLNGVETIYYFTLRTCCMIYKDKPTLVKLHKEYENVSKPEIDLQLKPYFIKRTKTDKPNGSIKEEKTTSLINLHLKPSMRKHKANWPSKIKKEDETNIYMLPYLP